MATSPTALEDVPVQKFHWRLLAIAGGSTFVDGYLLGIIGIALSLLTPDLALGPLWVGVLGASSMIGMFAGSLVFGRITDKVGRRSMFTITIIVFVIGSVVQFFVVDATQLLIVRLILGIAIGADYPIASSYVAELAPKKHRGSMLASMILFWWTGYVVSFVVGYLMSGTSWRWMLASSAVPAFVVLLLRLGFPESPRWLISKGRVDEANKIIKQNLGSHVFLDEFETTQPARKIKPSELLRGGYLKLIIFTSVFWICQGAPSYAIHTLQPQLFSALKVEDPLLGTMVVTVLSLVGVIPAMIMVRRIGRRPLLLVTFVLMALPLLSIGAFPTAAAWLLILGFIIFTVSESAGSVLQFVYPGELFPTEVRATAAGFATAMSRIGASISTFLLPAAYTHLGIGPAMLITAAIVLIGLAVSVKLAPETRNLTLHQASSFGRSH